MVEVNSYTGLPLVLPERRWYGRAAMAAWRTTRLWQETRGIPETLAATLASAPTTGTLFAGESTRRIVATGNGASYYVALALWLAALETGAGPEVVAVPAGLVARGAFRWRDGDALLAISTSGEMRDVIEALDAGVPVPVGVITSQCDSTIARKAVGVGRVTVASQDAVTHTQAFCGNVAATLAWWATLSGDAGLAHALRGAPEAVDRACDDAEEWTDDLAPLDPSAAVVFGTRTAWAAALEGALLLKEVAGVPAEGVETREGATSAMYALGPGHLVVSLSLGDDPLAAEAEAICATRGADVIRAPGGALADPRLATLTTFPALVALAARLGVARGLDVDAPAWTGAYYRAARGST